MYIPTASFVYFPRRHRDVSPSPPSPPSRFQRWIARIIDWCEHVIWLPIRAHLLAAQCKLKGHHGVSFARHVEWWSGYWGDVSCDQCNVVYWVRHSTIVMRLGQRLCTLLGHAEYDHPIAGLARGYIRTKFYCVRCMSNLDAQTAARLPRRKTDTDDWA